MATQNGQIDVTNLMGTKQSNIELPNNPALPPHKKPGPTIIGVNV